MFKCKVCSEKDSRIADLKEQISLLSKMAYPSSNPSVLPSVVVESDRVLSGTQEALSADRKLTKEELSSLQEVEEEAQRILTGNF